MIYGSEAFYKQAYLWSPAWLFLWHAIAKFKVKLHTPFLAGSDGPSLRAVLNRHEVALCLNFGVTASSTMLIVKDQSVNKHDAAAGYPSLYKRDANLS